MARTSTARLRWQAASILLGVVGVLVVAVLTPLPDNWNNQLQDWLLRQTTREALPENFALVALDEPSIQLDAVGPEEVAESRALQLMKGGFPWSREVYAILARQLLQAGARLVIFDMLFPSPREGDAEFAAVLGEYPGQIVLASNFEVVEATGKPSIAYFYPPNPQLAAAAANHFGFATFPRQSIIRYLLPFATTDSLLGNAPRPDEKAEPSLATVSAQLLGKDIAEDFQPKRFRYSEPKSVQVFPLYELLVPAIWKQNHRDGAVFKDRIVLIGATAEGMKDYFVTPFGRLSGPEIQLHTLAATLRGQWLGGSGTILSLASIPLAGLAVFLLAMFRRSPKWFIAGLVFGAVAWVLVCAAVLAAASCFLPFAHPLLTWLVCGFAGLACDVSLERRERGRLRGTLERYVSKDVVKEIVDNPDSFLQTLGGQRKEIIAMFSDLKGFTSDSEKLDPTELVALLNEYFGEMVGVVFERKGTLDKFMGDAFMATWGCIREASPQEDARNAIAAALDMKDRLAAMNVSRQKRGATLWSSGFGICQGPAVFGNIGSQQKMEPTVIGDTVNLASRFEGLTRMYDCGILVDERIAANARGECEFLLVDEVRVKGRRKTERLFFAHREKDTAWTESFTAAREKYLAGDFAAARDVFGKLAQGGLAPGLAARFVTRCEGFFRVLPETGWDGVWDFVDK